MNVGDDGLAWWGVLCGGRGCCFFELRLLQLVFDGEDFVELEVFDVENFVERVGLVGLDCF